MTIVTESTQNIEMRIMVTVLGGVAPSAGSLTRFTLLGVRGL